MKSKISLLGFICTAGCVHGAQIDLQNPFDGSASITMSPGQTSDVNLVIITASINSIPIAFVNAFLDTDNDLAEVVGLSGVQNWTYDRTAFTLPAAIDQVGENEYGLVSGDSDGGDAMPLGSATHIIDVLTLSTDASSGSTAVTFELNARAPQVFGPAPDYYSYGVCPPYGWCDLGNYLFVGDNGSTNSPFVINYIPEPSMTLMMILGTLIRIRRR